MPVIFGITKANDLSLKKPLSPAERAGFLQDIDLAPVDWTDSILESFITEVWDWRRCGMREHLERFHWVCMKCCLPSGFLTGAVLKRCLK